MSVSQTTPEPRADIAAQIAAMTDPAHPKDAVFVAKGNNHALPDNPPPGVHTVIRGEGTLLTNNPAKAVAFAQANPLTDDHMAKILDYPQTKSAAIKSGNPMVIQAQDKNGNVIHEALVADNALSKAHGAIARHLTPGGSIQVMTPLRAQVRRATLNAGGK